MRRMFWLLVLLSAGLIQNARAESSTFSAFGGEAGLVRIMDDLMLELLKDPRTEPFFRDTDQAHVKKMLVEQLCALLDGGCTYTGLNMQTAHEGMGVKREHFNALIENLQVAMDRNRVPFRAQNKLLAKLAPMHRDIVEKELLAEEALPDEI